MIHESSEPAARLFQNKKTARPLYEDCAVLYSVFLCHKRVLHKHELSYHDENSNANNFFTFFLFFF
ncbi:hypothetical cytosolic protein [Syntrophus aciditrophicus SB]|uniref:Hypothetical cytosolic protein n=1 Tax=Syntrophus aciditrophicus (strain SB) TaxID=56780 RepID=Q2LY25_SYNAS|nr:hypothetical cytosolic protein [Syntrophus aciditrophicus SB]